MTEFRFKIEADDFAEAVKRAEQAAAIAVKGGVAAAIAGAKTDMRRALEASGLGPRLGGAIGSRVYPEGPSLRAAGVIFARGGEKWDAVLRAYAEGASIVRKDGAGWLAIPTDNVPVLGRGVPKTPKAVEFYYGRPLRYVPPHVAGARSGKRVALLVLDRVVAARSARSASRRGKFRAATTRRLADGRTVQSVVMFVLVPHAAVRARFDPNAIMRDWADRAGELAAAAMEGA